MRTGLYRQGTRAADHPTPARTAEQALKQRADAVIDDLVKKDADRARVWLDGQAQITTGEQS